MHEENKRVINIPRYSPLRNVLQSDWNDDWDEMKKIEAIITGGDNTSHIQACIDSDVLSVRIVLDRIDEFVRHKDTPPDYAFKGINFDAESMYKGLKQSLKTINNLLLMSPENDVKLVEKLLLLMFELGSQVGAINNQDLILKGMESIKKAHRGGYKNGQEKKDAGVNRKKAYLQALKTAKQCGFKPTTGGLKSYLKSLKGDKFETGVNECPQIWIDGNSFYDTNGAYSDSSVSKIKIK